MTSIIFPSEWHPQSAIQITWPHLNSDWAYILDEVVDTYIHLSKAIIKYTKLLIVCSDAKEVQSHFTIEELERIIVVEMETNDTWARDHGAISVFIDEVPTIYDFGFNAWGLKFASNFDNQITSKLYKQGIFKKEVDYQNRLNFVLEGGAIESDGKGTLLTTSKCLLAPNRNEPLNKQQIEEYLKATLGFKRVLWLNSGYLAGDDTDNHIDTLARFCDENTIAYVSCNDEEDEHYQELKQMEKELEEFRTLENKPYNLIALPMADVVYEEDYRLPATYANFLILNEAVLVPTYRSSQDSLALEQLQKAFPTKEIVGIDCSCLIRQHGSLHCITMQYPEGFI